MVSDTEGKMTKRAVGGGGTLSQRGRFDLEDFTRVASLA